MTVTSQPTSKLPSSRGSARLTTLSTRQVFFSPRGNGTRFTNTVVPRGISWESSV